MCCAPGSIEVASFNGLPGFSGGACSLRVFRLEEKACASGSLHGWWSFTGTGQPVSLNTAGHLKAVSVDAACRRVTWRTSICGGISCICQYRMSGALYSWRRVVVSREPLAGGAVCGCCCERFWGQRALMPGDWYSCG